MKVENISTEYLLNVEYKVDHFLVNDEGIERLWKLYCLYNETQYKRAKDNYTKESFDYLVSEGRFALGAMTLHVNNELIYFCGLAEYNGWMLITRAAFIKYFKFPFTTAYLMPEMIKYAKSIGKKGIISTFNSYNKLIFDRLTDNRLERFKSKSHNSNFSEHHIFTKANEIGEMFKTLDYTVNYKNTEQYVAYIPFLDNEIPVFEKYESNFL